jgi:hypothetical protein
MLFIIYYTADLTINDVILDANLLFMFYLLFIFCCWPIIVISALIHVVTLYHLVCGLAIQLH